MENLVEKEPNKLTDEELVQVLEQADSVISFIESVKEYALSQMMEGKEIPNFKVVEGRSVRKYKDEELVAQAAKDHGYTDIYRQSLITMTEMQKLMGKKQFDQILGDLIVKSPGKPILVPMSDKRPAINVINEFKQED